MRLFWTFAAFVAMSMGAVGASAEDRAACRNAADPDNPMTTNQTYGVASCNAHRARRYHTNDYAGGMSWRNASEDPMVWNGNQWGSDLFHGYSHNSDGNYDRRFHPRDEAPAMVRIEIKRRVNEGWVRSSEMGPPPARPQLRVFGTRSNRLGATLGDDRSHGRSHGVLNNVRGDCPTCRAATVPTHARCARPGGMLILAWDGHRGVPVCPLTGPWNGRIMLPPSDPGHDEG